MSNSSLYDDKNTQAESEISDENVAFENLMAAFLAYTKFDQEPDFIFDAIRENLVDPSPTAQRKSYTSPADFDGLAVWVCADHDDLVMFLPTSKEGQDVDNCPACGQSVFESDQIFPLFLTSREEWSAFTLDVM